MELSLNANKNLTKEIEKLTNEYDLIQNEYIRIEESNIMNIQKIENYKFMMENVILEFHKLCIKILN